MSIKYLIVICNIINKTFIRLLIPNVNKYWVIDLLQFIYNWLDLHMGYITIGILSFLYFLIINNFKCLLILIFRHKFIIILFIKILFRKEFEMYFKFNYSPYFIEIILFLYFISNCKNKVFFIFLLLIFKVTYFRICYSQILLIILI